MLVLNDTSSTAVNPVVVGNLTIGGSSSSGNGVGVLAAAANQFGSSSVVTFYNGNSNAQDLTIHANQTLAGLNGAGGGGVVQIGANTDGTNYGNVTLTLDGSGNYSFGGAIRSYDAGGNSLDALSVVMSGIGTQTLSGSNSFSGGLTILTGTIIGGNANNNSLGSGTITIGNSANTGQSATLDTSNGPNSGSYGETYSNPITVSGNGTDTLGVIGYNSTYTGNISLANNLSIISNNSGGSTLTASGNISGSGNLTLAVMGTNTGSGVKLTGASINNTGTITNNGTGVGTATISGNIGTNVNGVIQNSATSQLILSGSNTYHGNTTISAGTLLFSGDSALPTSATLTVASGATVSLADGTARTSTVGGLTLAGGSTVVLDWNGGAVDQITTAAAATTSGNMEISINPSNSPRGSNLTVLSAASGLSNAHYLLVNNSNYTATISGNDTVVQVSGYNSATDLTNEYWYGGQVSGAANAMAFSNGTSNWSSGAIYSATGLVPGSSTNVIFSTTSGASQESSIVLGASMSVAGVTFNDTTLVTIANDGFTLTVGSGFIAANQNASINEPVVFTGAGELAKAATNATLTLGSVTFTGTSTIGDGSYNGNVSITGPLMGPSGYKLVISGTLNYSGTGGSVTTVQQFGVGDGNPATMNMTAGSLTVNTGSGTYGQFFIGNTNTGVLNVSGGSLTVSGVNCEIGGDVNYGSTGGNGTLTVSGSALVQLTGTASSPITFGYKGATGVLNLNGGTLQTAGSFVKETGNGTINFNGGKLQASGNNVNWIQGVTSKVQSGGAIIDTQGYSVAIAQNLLNGGGTDGGLKKLGAGVLTMTGASTYNGGTTISAGTIRANGSSQSLGTGTVTINNGGTLGGNGSVGNGTNAVTVFGGATITAGQDVITAGKLTTGNETWVAGGKFLDKITNVTAVAGTGYDQVAMGALSLSSLSSSTPFVVALSTLGVTPANFSAASSDSWTIATFTSATGGPTLTGSNTVLATAAPNTAAASSGMFALDTTGFSGTSSARRAVISSWISWEPGAPGACY